MSIKKLSSARQRPGIIKYLRELAREPWYPQEVEETELVKLDRAQTQIEAHAQRAEQAYTEFVRLPRAA
jgi:hypothetical protein